MRTDIKADPKIVRKARIAFFSALGLVFLWNTAVFMAVDGYGMLFHINIYIPAFFVLRLVIMLIAAFLFFSFLAGFFVDPYVRKISGADSYFELMEAYREEHREEHS